MRYLKKQAVSAAGALLAALLILCPAGQLSASEPAAFPEEGGGGDFHLDVEYIQSYEQQQCSDMIFFGDSRVVGMSMYAGGYNYVGKVAAGYPWMASEGMALLTEQMDMFPQADIVSCFGINDLGNIGAYIGFYRYLQQAFPNRRFWFMSVNPVSERQAAASGYSVRNAMIEPFNSMLLSAFPDRYIDCYTYLYQNGVGTDDGVHYFGDTYAAVQDFAWRSIALQLDSENERRQEQG